MQIIKHQKKPLISCFAASKYNFRTVGYEDEEGTGASLL